MELRKLREVKLKGELLYVVYEPPIEFLEAYKHKDIEFITDEFEELILQDIMRYDQDTLQKISRNVTPKIKSWIDNKIKKKENVSINCKGTTRSGKSLGMLAINDEILDFYGNKDFDPEYIVCANQKEYRQKLRDADFGDNFQIDENAFAHVGLGSVTEMQQLKDIQNIIAKKNIHTIYITPRVFLETNASLGLSTWGKDVKNWLSRFLLYDLRNRTIPLLGYVIVDVGKLFRKYGCYVYKQTGGCTNPNRVTFDNLDKKAVEYSDCIPKVMSGDDAKKITNDGKSCPFYHICKHPLVRYEHKKDKWIDKEMKGGLDERTSERYETALKLTYRLSHFDENGVLKLKARDGKQLKVKVNLYAPDITSTKYTQNEIDELIILIKGFTNIHFMKEVCERLHLNWIDALKNIEGHEVILENLDEYFNEKDINTPKPLKDKENKRRDTPISNDSPIIDKKIENDKKLVKKGLEKIKASQKSKSHKENKSNTNDNYNLVEAQNSEGEDNYNFVETSNSNNDDDNYNFVEKDNSEED